MERFGHYNTDSNPESSKDRISDEEMSNLLAGLGNHEAKAMTLLVMGDDAIYTATDLHKLIVKSQGDNPGWRMGKGTAFEYCRLSLSPIGLVTLEATDPDGTVFGYTKTEYGKELGDSLAGHLLSFSERHPELSLRQIFGGTIASNSKSLEVQTGDEVIDYKKRSPLTRIKIFRILTTSDLPLRARDISNQVNPADPSNVALHLKELARSNIINYVSMKGDSTSETDVTFDQRNTLNELLGILDNFQTKDAVFRNEGLALARQIVKDEKRVSTLLAKAKEKSPNTKGRSKAENFKIINEIIIQQPGITSQGLRKILDRDYEIKLGRQTISAYLKQMEKEMRIKRSYKKTSIHWVAVETGEE